MVITKSDPEEGIVYDLYFEGMPKSTGSIELEEPSRAVLHLVDPRRPVVQRRLELQVADRVRPDVVLQRVVVEVLVAATERHTEDLRASGQVRRVHHDPAVEPAGPQKRRVEDLRAVRRRQDARVVLHGTDPVENLTIDWADGSRAFRPAGSTIGAAAKYPRPPRYTGPGSRFPAGTVRVHRFTRRDSVS